MSRVLQAAVDERGEPLTSTVNAWCTRYLAVCRAHLPALPLVWWRYLADVASTTKDADPASLCAVIAVSNEARHLDRVHGIDVAHLCESLRSLPFAGRVAVLDAAERLAGRARDGEHVRMPYSAVAAVVGADRVTQDDSDGGAA